MAGDLRVQEWASAIEATEQPGITIHRYGRIAVNAADSSLSPSAAGADTFRSAAPAPTTELTELTELADLTLTEQLGLAALRLRESARFRIAKWSRP